jgi:uncharacterized protein YjhX (UPF0386 family)
MDISRAEQRILHILAKGGWITLERNEARKIIDVQCMTREGWRHPGLSLRLFRRLKYLRAIRSTGGGPYRITRRGLLLVRSQLDNQ